MKLLPTPVTMDPSENMTPEEFDVWRAKNRLDPVTGLPRSGNGHGDSIHMAVKRGGESWGKYTPAIQRWEQIMGPSPEPSKDGKLSAEFVSWMMGYSRHWTHGKRNVRLKQLGNAVVPQQGEFAIRQLLSQLQPKETA
jgi:DNA (cytosine-5)-methyltransferase 1